MLTHRSRLTQYQNQDLEANNRQPPSTLHPPLIAVPRNKTINPPRLSTYQPSPFHKYLISKSLDPNSMSQPIPKAQQAQRGISRPATCNRLRLPI
jgi:hypothetical protein